MTTRRRVRLYGGSSRKHSHQKVYIRCILYILYILCILYIQMYSSNILFYSSLYFVYFFLSSAGYIRLLIYNSVRTQNFHSPSLLTRFNLCLIASLDEATVSQSSLCVR